MSIAKTVHLELDEENILLITTGNHGDTYIASDTGKIYTVRNGKPLIDEHKELVYVPVFDSVESRPVEEITNTNGLIRVDSRASTYKGTQTGGSGGIHNYSFTGNKNTVDLLLGGTPATLVAGANVDLSNEIAEKNIAGNTWNSTVYSQESFDPNVQDFAVTWLVEDVDGTVGDTDGITGTIREMGGLDNNPGQNQSYSSIEFAIYQVNNYFYSRVYESGSALAIPGYSTIYFQVGDKMGVRVVDGVVTYFILRGATIIDVYTSEKKATEPLYWKGAFNRGVGSSGESVIGGVEFYTQTRQDTFNVSIEGSSVDNVSDSDKAELLQKAGINIAAGSKYSDISFSRIDTTKFSTGGTSNNIDILHGYTGLRAESNKTISF